MRPRIAAIAALFVCIAPASPQDLNTDLVQAANQVTAYWRGVFAACSDPQFPRGALYAEVIAGRFKGGIIQIANPSFQFRTDQIEPLAALNGTEFSATSTLSALAARYFEPKKGWTPWNKATEITIGVRKESGKWSLVETPNGVSFTPEGGGPEASFRAGKCNSLPK